MRRTPGQLTGSFRFVVGVRLAIVPLLLVACASLSLADDNPLPACRVNNKGITYPGIPYPEPPPGYPLTYPMTSDRYAVQYRVGFGEWTDAKVDISYYGGTNSSPLNDSSGYTTEHSMSFVSIPVRALTLVQLRVTKLFDSGFKARDHVSVRPSAKWIAVDLENGKVGLSTLTGRDFAGDQFLLWWGDAAKGGAVEGLVFFLDPPYKRPTGANVRRVTELADLSDLSHYDTLDFEGTVTLANDGASALEVPANINSVYFAPGSWVQGKLRFVPSGEGHLRRIYGPGVLDVSRFEYDLRACSDDTTGYADQGYQALSWEDLRHPNQETPDRFLLDGIVITDHNHATADLLVDGVVNNVKSIGWNGLNGGFRLGDHTTVSNVFLRSGDDSLMMWGTSITVTNATVWQTYNGAVVNLGWGAKSPGDDGLIDGLYVVRTDWHSPVDPIADWMTDTLNDKNSLNGQNNAVIASLMVPGTMFGSIKPSLYRNILVDDPPRTLFSLKIISPQCTDPNGPRDGNCTDATLTQDSVLNLRIENVLTPPSIVENSIGFQTVDGTTLTGAMHIRLTNVFVKLPDGTFRLLTGADPTIVGNLVTHGDKVTVKYGF